MQAIAVITRWVVRGDWLFTATTVVFQPLSGLYMMHLAGIPLTAPWIAWSWALYFLAGACWLPVVWIQIRMRDLAQRAPPTARRCRRSTGGWSACGSRSDSRRSLDWWWCSG